MTRLYKTPVSILGTLSLVFLLMMTGLSAQSQERVCLSHEHEIGMRKKYPELGTKEQFEERFSKVIESVKAQRSGLPEVITIPIIFHIIHDGETVGTGDNLSADLVYAQLDQLNADFRRLEGTTGYNENPVGADTNIEFALALIDEDGNLLPEPGINRINRNDMGWNAPPYDGIGSNYIDGTIKPDSYWDPNQYLNFWAMDLSGGLLGYAQFPSLSGLGGMPNDGGPAETDGVVLLTSSMGSSVMPNPNGPASFNEGRTATHEIGHWLGLRHIWGDGGCSVDDFVQDTPEQGFSSSGCPTDQDSCPGDEFTDMVENYMDYSSDFCMNVFTQGQKLRMETVMAVSPRRVELLSSTVHLAPFPNLIISEVMDGNESGGVPKYVEIHNASEEIYDLTTVVIKIFANGATRTNQQVGFSEGTMLVPGQSYVIANDAFQSEWGGVFTEATPDQTSSVISGNGDDIYEIYDTDTEQTIDRYGELGVDGTNTDWEYVNGNVTRKSYVLRANNGNFSAENWDYLPYSNETATPGSHVAEQPAFDPVLVGIEGIEDGDTYFACEGFILFEPGVIILNAGAASLTSVELQITNSAGELGRGLPGIFTTFFEPALGPGEVGVAELPGFGVDIDGEFLYGVEIIDEGDGNPSNNEPVSVDYAVNIFQDASILTVETQTDEYPDETIWTIETADGTLIYESEELEGSTFYIDEFCLEDGDYTFTLIDTYGDGIAGGFSSLYVGEDLVITIPGDHPDFDVFFGPDPRSVSFNFSIPFVPSTDLAVELLSPVGGDLSGCFDQVLVEAIVTNTGTSVVNSFELSFGSGELEFVGLSDLFFLPGEEIELSLGLVTLSEGSNTVEVNIEAVSDTAGFGDDNSENNSDQATINFSASDENGLLLTLFTDSYPGETSWGLTDAAGAVIAMSGELPESNVVLELFCLADGDYSFNLYDSYGDGIFSELAVVLEDDLGQELGVIPGDFGAFASIEFSLPFVSLTDAAIEIVDPFEGDLVTSCSSVTPVSIAVTNTGNTVITNISLALNEEAYIFEDILFLPGEGVEFELGTVDLTVGANSISASITSVNGEFDDDGSNDLSTVNVTFELDEESTAVEIDLNLDAYPEETSWAIFDDAGNIVAEGDDFFEEDMTITENACLIDGCYTLELYDSWGDGGPSADVVVDGEIILSIAGENWGTIASGVFCVGDALRPVSNFEAAAAGAFSINLSWDYDFDEDGFQILRSFTGEEGSYAFLADVGSTDRTYTDSNGLEELTTYYYAIVSKRGDETSLATFTQGSTRSNIGETELYEGFEGEVFPPEGWSMQDVDGDQFNWFLYLADGSAFQGDQSAASASYDNDSFSPLNPDNYLITPKVSVNADYVLTFAIAAQDPSYANEKYSVLVSTSGTNTTDFTDDIITETLADADWRVKEFSLSSYAGSDIYIAFRHWDVSDEFLLKLDEVFVGLEGDNEPDGVAAPSDLVASAVSAYQIDLTWTHPGADEFVILRSLSEQIGSFEVVEIIPGTETAFSDVGLTPETTYYYEVRAVSGDATSVGAIASATTQVEQIGEFKLSESFEGDIFPPEGWYMVDEDGDNFNWFLYAADGSAYDGDQSAASASYDNDTFSPLTPDNYLVTPEVTVEAGDFLVYYVAAQDADWAAEKYSVLISTSGTNTSDFTNEVTTETLSSVEWGKREFDLANYVGQTIRIAWRHHDVTDQFLMKIDDVKVGDPSAGDTPPAAPSDLAATATGYDQINLTWSDNSDNEDEFILQTASAAEGPWSDAGSMMVDATTHSDIGLMEETTYFYRIKSSNSVGESAWSNIASATTDELILGLDKLGDATISYYPNPVSGNLIIEFDRNSEVNVSVFDYNGKRQRAELIREGKNLVLDMTNLSTGLYFVTLSNADGELNWRILKK